jgi:hypothetical protein
MRRAPALPEPPLTPEPPRKDTPAPPVDAITPEPKKTVPEVTECPRCKSKLVDVAGLGWCPRCGYCHSLEQDRAAVPLPTRAATENAKKPKSEDVILLLGKVPGWSWVMLAGAALLFLCTALIGYSQHLTPFGRCLWCTVQIAVGAVVLFLANFWALLCVAAEDETITAKDIFFPIRLWTLTCKRLPRTRAQLWLAAWGLAAILSAAVFVGGLGEWLKYLPKPSTANVPPAKTQKN